MSNLIEIEEDNIDIPVDIAEDSIDIDIGGVEAIVVPDQRPPQVKVVVPSEERQIVKADDGYRLEATEVEPIPSEFKKIQGTIELNSNGEHNVGGFGIANVNVQPTNGVQWKIKTAKSLRQEFYADSTSAYKYTDLTGFFEGLDTSEVEDFYNMCRGQTQLVIIPKFDTSGGKNFGYMFYSCRALTGNLEFDLSMAENVNNMFYELNSTNNIKIKGATNLRICDRFITSCRGTKTVTFTDRITLPSNVTYMFSSSNNITHIYGILDFLNVTNAQSFIGYCVELQEITLKNIKTNLQIGLTETWGLKLTDETLINTAKELWDLTGSTSRTLTVSTPSNARFDAIYVKLVTPTAEQIAEDPYINNKKPCEVCESTDEGATTLREYVVSKNWALA